MEWHLQHAPFIAPREGCKPTYSLMPWACRRDEGIYYDDDRIDRFSDKAIVITVCGYTF